MLLLEKEPKKSTKMSSEIAYVVIKPDDRQRVLDFLLEHYHPEEPLNNGYEPEAPAPEDNEFYASQIEHGLSVMAVLKTQDQKERIVGVAISGPKDRNEAQRLDEEVKRLGPTKWGKALEFLSFIEKQANVYDRYNVEKVLHSHGLGVHKQMRGKGIGNNLKQKVEELGKSLGYELKTADCSSIFAAKLLERRGYDCVYTIFYKDYKDEKGEQVFHMPPPHDACRSFAKRL